MRREKSLIEFSFFAIREKGNLIDFHKSVEDDEIDGEIDREN